MALTKVALNSLTSLFFAVLFLTVLMQQSPCLFIGSMTKVHAPKMHACSLLKYSGVESLAA